MIVIVIVIILVTVNVIVGIAVIVSIVIDNCRDYQCQLTLCHRHGQCHYRYCHYRGRIPSRQSTQRMLQSKQAECLRTAVAFWHFEAPGEGYG